MTAPGESRSTTAGSPGGRPPYVVVVGLDCMTGLQSARILAGHGIPVIAIAKNPDHYCCRTTVCERILYANTGTDEFLDVLANLDLDEKAVLYPCTDMSVFILSQNRERFTDRYHVALPPHDVVEMLMDKVRFYTWAAREGLAIPGTFFLRTRVDAEKAVRELSFPCILKPPMKTPTWEANTSLKVFKVDSPDHFLSTYDKCSGWADTLMVQEWIEGTDANLYSYNGYFNQHSRPLVSFIARKLRQWPPEIGTSCLGEEVRNDEVLRESIRLFETVGYQGLGYVEMKKDERTGNHYIIEPNIGRPTGRSAIAEAGGVELLYTKYCDLVGRPLPEGRVQTYGGVKWISLRRDLQSAFFYWRRGDLTFADWWRSWRGRKGYAVFSWTDPMPFLVDLFRSVGLAFGGEKKKPKPPTSPPAAVDGSPSETAAEPARVE